MNLSQFRTSISREIGLDNTAASTEQGYMDEWVNRGVLDVLRKTRCYVKPDQMVLQANNADYATSQSILEIVAFDLTPASGAVGSGLKRVGLDEIIERRRVAQVVMAPYMFAFTGTNLISFFPTPSAADTATIYYVPRPSTMSATGDDPSTSAFGNIPPEYHDAIELYAFNRAASYDDSAEAANYYQLYQRRVREIRREVQRMGGTKLPKMRVASRYGRGRRHFGFPPGVDIKGIDY